MCLLVNVSMRNHGFHHFPDFLSAKETYFTVCLLYYTTIFWGRLCNILLILVNYMLQYRNMNIQTKLTLCDLYTNNCTTFCATFFWSRSEPGRAETRLGFQPAPGHGARESHGRRLAVDAVGLGHGRCGALGLGGPLGCLQRALGHRAMCGCRCVLFLGDMLRFQRSFGAPNFLVDVVGCFFLKRTTGISCELRGSVKLFFQPCDFGAGYLEKSHHVVRGWISNFCEVAHPVKEPKLL